MPAEAIFDQLDPVMVRWTIGGQAAGLAPDEWSDALAGGDAGERELCLVALAGQYLALCVAPEPASALTPVAEIPPLPLPLLPPVQARLARRCLRALKEGGGQRHLAAMLASRGYAVHPADWMPSRHDDSVPDVYAAWRDWAEQQAAGDKPADNPDQDLSEANWGDWWPAARRNALARIRAEDPARATALLAAKAGSEGAEARLRLIECLIPGLSAADVPYLESLASDRAPKIKALAASLLARLGRGSGTGEDAAELAGFFEFQTKGLLRRTRVLMPRPVKTPAQRSRREALFAQVDFSGFAAALGISDGELAAMWPFGTEWDADAQFAQSAAQTASDQVIATLCARLTADGDAIDMAVFAALQPRLTPDQRMAFARLALAAKGGRFDQLLAIAGAGAGIDGLAESRPGRALISAASGEADIVPELRALALVASQSAASAVFERLTAAGLSASDPRLDLLRLNIAVDHSGVYA